MNHKEHTTTDDSKNLLEWVVFYVSLLLVIVILGYLGYKAFTFVSSPPDLTAVYKHDPSKYAPYRYHVLVKNQGGETAEEVNVELVLEKAGEELEVAELQIPFSPRASEREGWVNFKTDPATADTLTARVISYKKPE
ncbi:hypothetical protein [Pontibacter vulgaris]|uniref:hypothetical protein n=1 Tax=Pontibacter vulgaris TaxID=2905679 RepID=UPI001FA7601D|nr:hypothetical protein [Pontibacter vulgaris]